MLKEGDIVRIKPGTRYYGTDRANPADVDGTITNISRGEHSIRVIWSDTGTHNGYCPEDLYIPNGLKIQLEVYGDVSIPNNEASDILLHSIRSIKVEKKIGDSFKAVATVSRAGRTLVKQIIFKEINNEANFNSVSTTSNGVVKKRRRAGGRPPIF